MRIHHLSCGSMCPVGGALWDGQSAGPLSHLVCHCLLIEAKDELILVDTGFGTRDVDHPHRRLSEFFLQVNNVRLRADQTAIAQIKALGFSPKDVRHIVLTHLDFDHAGGLEDFPHATVHLLAREKEAADAQDGGAFVGTRRYRPKQWNDVKHWQTYRAGEGEGWFGFETVRELKGLPPEILLVPLAGHTWGHSGVAIRRGGGDWLLHAGDAYFYRGEVGQERPDCTPGLAGYQKLMEVDRAARLANQAKLRRLSIDHAGDVRLFCAHDPVEFAILAEQSPHS